MSDLNMNPCSPGLFNPCRCKIHGMGPCPGIQTKTMPSSPFSYGEVAPSPFGERMEKTLKEMQDAIKELQADQQKAWESINKIESSFIGEESDSESSSECELENCVWCREDPYVQNPKCYSEFHRKAKYFDKSPKIPHDPYY